MLGGGGTLRPIAVVVSIAGGGGMDGLRGGSDIGSPSTLAQPRPRAPRSLVGGCLHSAELSRDLEAVDLLSRSADRSLAAHEHGLLSSGASGIAELHARAIALY